MSSEHSSDTPAPRVHPPREGAPVVEILAVGQGLLRGRTADANSSFLAGTLTDRGARVTRIVTVPADAEAIGSTLRESLERQPHLVVVHGGLGPGHGDHTHEGVAAGLARPLSPSDDARRHVEQGYARLAGAGRVAVTGMTLTREKLARLPLGAVPLLNPKGVSVGALSRLPGGTAIVSLPGRPAELRATWELAAEALKDILPRQVTSRREVESPTVDESELRDVLRQLQREHPTVVIATHPAHSPHGNARALVELEASAENGREATTRVEAALRRLMQLAASSRELLQEKARRPIRRPDDATD